MREEKKRPRFFGRRKGHKLSPSRQALIEQRLPEISIPLNSEVMPIDPSELFNPPVKEVWMEIGFGAGEHLAHQAQANPEVGFLGIEPFINGTASLLSKMEQLDITNIRILNDDVWLLLDNLPENSLSRVFINFSDPWPKKRHHRRRLFSHDLLDKLSCQMLPGSELRFASDNINYVRHALETVNCRADFTWDPTCSRDWKYPPVDSIETRYGTKARRAGRSSFYLKFKKV